MSIRDFFRTAAEHADANHYSDVERHDKATGTTFEERVYMHPEQLLQVATDAALARVTLSKGEVDEGARRLRREIVARRPGTGAAVVDMLADLAEASS